MGDAEQPISVSVYDPATGEIGVQDVKPGGYVVVCHEPAYVAHEQVYGNGTRVVTIKKRGSRDR